MTTAIRTLRPVAFIALAFYAWHQGWEAMGIILTIFAIMDCL